MTNNQEFPPLGFPDEQTVRNRPGYVDFYACRPTPNTIGVIWRDGNKSLRAGVFTVNKATNDVFQDIHDSNVGLVVNNVVVEDFLQAASVIHHLTTTLTEKKDELEPDQFDPEDATRRPAGD